MDRFLNALKAHAQALDRAQAQPRFALVASVDPARYAARVTLQPEGVLTGWLPILSPWIGAGWGMVCPPRPGDQVLVVAQEGDADNGVIVGGSFSDAARAPAAPVGELWLVHASGSFVKLQNDGTVRVQGNLHVDGNVFVQGDIEDRHGALARLRDRYNIHTHPDPQGGSTSLPVPRDADEGA
ncbi:phage baseplate assembly protein V [Limobrevibacterium gyesilva]|uniref:Phage baseplate assembly protein V n=1 Tax=Limobrevibacterium gyesilva TaxID=2991712 RepID=A0AA42CHV1_9PROT|nr:phage baseplate assembly protein V [Limobrevibacterium gyesilva]MCW3477646.1 phage baseplate assembly protein V [Limobrevibacterium gyesilva]